MACPTCESKEVVVSPDGEYVCVQCGTVLGPVYMWPTRVNDKRLAEKAAELSKGLRAVLVKRGVPLHEWLELGGVKEWVEQRRRLAAWIPPSKRVEYYIETTAAKLGLGRSALEEALALYRGVERRALVGKSPRVVAAVIYAATCTPARVAAEVLGVSPISVKDTVRKLRLPVKMCTRRCP